MNKKHSYQMKAACLGVIMGTMSLAATAADIAATDPVVREVTPVSATTAAFMTLKNNGNKDVQLTSVSSSVADKIEIHGHKMEGNTMKMYRVNQMDLPAHKSTALKSGGYHIMIMDLKQPLKAGEKVKLSLHFSDGDILDVEAPVKNLMAQKDLAHGKYH